MFPGVRPPRVLLTTPRLPSELLAGNSVLDKSAESKTLLIREQLLLPASKPDQSIESDLHLHLPLHPITDGSHEHTTDNRPFPRLNVHVHHHQSPRPAGRFNNAGQGRHEWPEMVVQTTSISASSPPTPKDLDVAGAGDGDQRWPPSWMLQSDRMKASSFNKPHSESENHSSQQSHHHNHPHHHPHHHRQHRQQQHHHHASHQADYRDSEDSQVSKSSSPPPPLRARLVHDGLPGFPPPAGSDFVFSYRSDRNHSPTTNENATSSRFDSSRLDNVELAADGAGFVIEPGQESMEQHLLAKYPTEINQYHQSRMFDPSSTHHDQLQAESTGTEWSKPHSMTTSLVKPIDPPISFAPQPPPASTPPMTSLSPVSEKLQSRLDLDTSFKPAAIVDHPPKPTPNFVMRPLSSDGGLVLSERVRSRMPETMRSSLSVSSKPSASSSSSSSSSVSLAAGRFPFFIAQKSPTAVGQTFRLQAQPSRLLRSQLLPGASLLPGLLRSTHFGMPFLIHSKQRRRRDVQFNPNPHNQYASLPGTRKYRIFAIDSPRLQPLIGHLPPQSSLSSDLSTLPAKLIGIPTSSSGQRSSASGRQSTTEPPLSFQPEANSQHRMRAGQPLSRNNGKLPVGGYNYASLTPGYQPQQPPPGVLSLGRKPMNSPVLDSPQDDNPPPSSPLPPPSSSAAGNDHNSVTKSEPEDDNNGSLFNLLNSFNGLGEELSGVRNPRPQSNDWKPSGSTETPQMTISSTSKYGILGSGNFEIIRGGFYKDLSEPKSAVKLDDKTPDKAESDQDEDGSVQDGGEDGDDGLRPVHSPGNGLGVNAVDPNQFLSNDFPLLGFQGFDDFARATNRRPYRRPIGLLI